MLKDYLALNSPHQFLNPHTIAHLDSERNKLLENLELFEMGTLDLKDSIYSLTSPACMNQLQCMEENELLLQKIDTLEFEKNVNISDSQLICFLLRKIKHLLIYL